MLAHSSKTKGKLAALEEQLRQDIFTRQLGDDQAISPELALAERFSVSRNSVRKVIEKLVNEGVLYRRQGSGTYVVPAGERHNGQDNHSLSRNIRQVVFLSMDTVLSEASFRSHGTFEPIFMGLNQVLQPRGYNLLLAHVGLDWQAPACLVNHDISGVIFHGEVDEDFWRQYIQPYPCVGLQYVNPDYDCDWVKQDNFNRSYQAVKYLKQHGHCRIGFVSNECDMLISRERFQGYRAALQQLSLPLNPDWEILWQRPRKAGILYSEDHMPDYQPYLQKAFAGSENPDAFVCIDNWRALCTMTALQNMGMRVPEDISLIGGYNTENPPETVVDGKIMQITRFNDRLEDICAVAASTLLDQFSGNKSQLKKTILLHPHFIEGHTVKKRAIKKCLLNKI